MGPGTRRNAVVLTLLGGMFVAATASADARSVRVRGSDALIMVDLQKDFSPGGALAVAAADRVVAKMNRISPRFVRAGGVVVASRDWHPADHTSFVEQGGPWPTHAVQDTEGAKFHAALQLPGGTHVVSKGTTRDVEAYSAFKGTDLAQRLRARGVKRVFVGGVATEYCVLETALGALDAGFQVHVIKGAEGAVDAAAGARALRQLQARGARIVPAGRMMARRGR
jgi:nicotinamidase/pyrazinamidase